MVGEVTTLLTQRKTGLWIDATVGDGGHAEVLLEATAPDGNLLGLDWDPEAVGRARARLLRYGGRVRILHANYTRLSQLVPGTPALRGVLLDAGVSSSQLQDSGRGFSFQTDGPLDMRMAPDVGPPAWQLVNSLPAENLAGLFARYGEERQARRIARAIVRERERAPVRTTRHLAVILERAGSSRPVKTKARIFQALRIAVNDELSNLRHFLAVAPSLLPAGSRLVVISYHSLEDRLVKEAFRRLASRCTCPREAPRCTCGGRARARLLTRRVLKPSAREVALNPKSRSARLRAIEMLEGD
jgi:16S rRNA (cytosine1402-N4)-methyltransferase